MCLLDGYLEGTESIWKLMDDLQDIVSLDSVDQNMKFNEHSSDFVLY